MAHFIPPLLADSTWSSPATIAAMGAVVLGVIAALKGQKNGKDIEKVHVIVNSQKTEMLKKIEALEAVNHELRELMTRRADVAKDQHAGDLSKLADATTELEKRSDVLTEESPVAPPPPPPPEDQPKP